MCVYVNGKKIVNMGLIGWSFVMADDADAIFCVYIFKKYKVQLFVLCGHLILQMPPVRVWYPLTLAQYNCDLH